MVIGLSEITKENINDFLSNLSASAKKDFSSELIDALYDRSWCETNNINYADPDIDRAKVELYKELFDV
ncbi:MAG: hypothetical protein AABX30_02400 [Nanoarchaeota archaeon]